MLFRNQPQGLGTPKRQTPEPKAGGHQIVSTLRKNALGRYYSEHPFALRFFTRQLAGTADGLGLLARFFLGRLFEMLLKLHFTKYALALELFLERTKRLIDIVVANTDLHVVVTTFLGLSCMDCRNPRAIMIVKWCPVTQRSNRP
jgi:hypothetical protein